ncbi:short-chain dehydrogenase [Mangrovactinospora gilvigrisea]|uniref:Short-chain dehydrogenase n=1 Tax=Mangrovactinospora gilvigrisea TaxID=1428644 RepID=A0A1J7BH65_9ACTN|nr:SDR family oxidoreductase [Mangrovactinospora gilvigrisea]OIV37917.1 short-chain dehydrogenase [Mangrovactinospora gilvigrisea]
MTGSPLNNRVIAVTGAARGVGQHLAEALAARGARIALVGLEPDRLKSVAERCGPDATAWDADVTDRARMAEVAEEIAARYGRVDAAVANAGVAMGGPFVESDAAAFERTLQVNLVGSTITARAFLPHLLATRGYLLQIASLAALTPAPLMTAYCASKAGVEAFAHALRAEVGHRGVGVGVAYLTWTDTEMVRGADRDEALRMMRSRLPWPLNRTYPVGPAAQRIADGVERRAAHVYGQWWLRGLQPLRGAIPAVTALGAPREMRRVDALATDAASRGLVGAGGAAAEQ